MTWPRLPSDRGWRLLHAGDRGVLRARKHVCLAVGAIGHSALLEPCDGEACEERSVRRRRSTAAVEGQPAGGLRPWREVVTPHRDVSSGRYQQAEFAADLDQVSRDEATPEYGKPEEFFRRTFITEGLRDLLLNSVRRLRGQGGDPIVELQTNFGGGKTHSLIALYHLAGGYSPAQLPGVEQMLAQAGLDAPPAAQIAVLVGQKIAPGTVHIKPDGTEVRTL